MTDARFPALRMRRLRRHDWTRRLVAETTLSPSDLIWPLFPIDGEKRREPVASMPGVEFVRAIFSGKLPAPPIMPPT